MSTQKSPGEEEVGRIIVALRALGYSEDEVVKILHELDETIVEEIYDEQVAQLPTDKAKHVKELAYAYEEGEEESLSEAILFIAQNSPWTREEMVEKYTSKLEKSATTFEQTVHTAYEYEIKVDALKETLSLEETDKLKDFIETLSIEEGCKIIDVRLEANDEAQRKYALLLKKHEASPTQQTPLPDVSSLKLDILAMLRASTTDSPTEALQQLQGVIPDKELAEITEKVEKAQKRKSNRTGCIVLSVVAILIVLVVVLVIAVILLLMR